MTDLTFSLKTENMALAQVTATSDHHVQIKITESDQWNAEGLSKLAAMLKGVAATIAATALLFGFMTVADATDWVPFNFSSAEAYYTEAP